MAPKDESRGEFKEMLLREGVVTLDVINEALREQDQTHQSLIDVLIRLGKLDEKKLVTVLMQLYGYACVNPGVFAIEKEVLDKVPQRIAEKYSLLPISMLENTITIAFANPNNLKAIDELRAITGMRIKVVVAQPSLLKKHIAKYYGQDGVPSNPSNTMPGVPEGQGLDEIVKLIEDEQGAQEPQELLKVSYETPVIKLVNMLLMEGIRRRASDIFIEPWENFIRVRTRVDGLLEEIIRPQKSLGPYIISRIKIMSELDIAENRVPQDGRFKIKVTGKEVDMRVSILPTCFGEKVCLRILDTTAQSHDISKLGFNEGEQTIIKDCVRKPHGMILVTGPTGSGKTTTLYSILKYLDSPEVNITTVEDPVEYQLPGINQVNVREQVGLTFPLSLRSILRQDPDIILIGEIRDNPTLDIAVKAALTGHLVLSTLHTNDATSSITRMMNMGLEPFLIASTVLMISAQRLVRRLCSRCRYPEDVDKDVLKRLEIEPSKATFFKGKGCSQCRQTGYKGRTVITELLPMTSDVRQSIMQGVSAEKIKVMAHSNGMTTLRQCAIRKALAGETTLEEVFRVTNEDQGLKPRHADDKEKGGKAA